MEVLLFHFAVVCFHTSVSNTWLFLCFLSSIITYWFLMCSLSIYPMAIFNKIQYTIHLSLQSMQMIQGNGQEISPPRSPFLRIHVPEQFLYPISPCMIITIVTLSAPLLKPSFLAISRDVLITNPVINKEKQLYTHYTGKYGLAISSTI